VESIGYLGDRVRDDKESHIAQLKILLPELARVPDDAIVTRRGDLYEVAKCRRKCDGCKGADGFLSCWRDGDARGTPYKLEVVDDEIRITQPICKPHLAFLHRQKQDALLKQSGMTADDRAFTFENYPGQQLEKHRRIFEWAFNFAEHHQIDEQGQGLFVFGPPGIAKTHLVLAITNRLNERGIPAIFVRTDNLIDQLRHAIASRQDVDEVLERYMTAQVLVLDEFAQERVKDFSLESILKILNARMRAKLPTFFTSNFVPTMVYQKHFDAYSEQIEALRSRLLALAIPAKMVGEDHRLNSIDLALGPDGDADA
jgi:primosomal protein DnaI